MPGADHGAADHDKHAGHSVDMFRQKFWGTLLLSIPTVIWAPMIQHWFGYTAPGGAAASRWVPAIFGTLVFAYGGWVFIQGAIGELRARLPGMMTLISLAISVAFVFSLAVTFGFPGSDLWWELATLVAISSPCYAEERRLLREHRNKLDAIVAHLLEHESRGEPEIYATAGRVGRSPRVLAGQVRRTFVDQRALP